MRICCSTSSSSSTVKNGKTNVIRMITRVNKSLALQQRGLGRLGAGSGLVALEVDEAKSGKESLKALMKNVVIPKNTTIVKTSDGPIYILMQFDGVTPTTRKILGAGLALVAAEACIVAPPEDNSDGSNGWWKNFPTDTEIAPVPKNWQDFYNHSHRSAATQLLLQAAGSTRTAVQPEALRSNQQFSLNLKPCSRIPCERKIALQKIRIRNDE